LTFIPGLLLFFPETVVKGERLSFKTYSAADGLASDDVTKIVADSHGFLWFCTVEGLSRFDGYKFKNYTQEQGLPHRNINDLLETAEGDYLVATSGGLAVFNPKGTAYRWNLLEENLEQNSSDAPLIKTYFINQSPTENPSKSIWTLAQDGNGNIFAATVNGIYRVVKNEGEWTFQKINFEDWEVKTTTINKLFTDSRKDIWIAASTAIYWMSKNGEIKKINDSGGNSIFEDREGKIWIDSGGNNIGIRIFEVKKDGSDAVLTKTYTTKDGLATNIFTNAVAHTEDGRIFVNSDAKLYEFLPDAPASAAKFKSLDNIAIRPATDRSGNVWFITPGKGVAKFSPKSFTTFDERDGIPGEFIRSIFSNQSGDIFFTAGSQKLIRRDRTGRIESIVPYGLDKRNWTHNFLDLQAANGEWWIPSVEGLRRYPKVANFSDLAKTPPKKIYTTADGLFGNGVFAIFEDSRGDIWVSTSDNDNNLVRFEGATEKIYQYTTADGLPEKNAPISFGEDAGGNIWISFYLGELYRYKDGKFRQFTAADGIPKGLVSNMLSDKKGRFWLAVGSRGLFRIDNPYDDAPKFVNFSTAEGLSSNRTLCLTEDDFGKIYVGTGRGINRIDPERQRVKIFTQADGLPGNIVSGCGKSSDGKLWFTTNNSLIQFGAQADTSAKPPPIFIDSLSINGNPRNVSEFGETEIKNLEFASDEKQIQIGFFAISLDKGESLRYQYKLEGQDWSQPDQQRTISFNLSSGAYNFQVQAVNSDGVVSEKPATVSFKISPPYWRTWWFLLSAFLLVGGAVFILDRYRVSKTQQVQTAYDELQKSERERREAEAALQTSREERLAELDRVRTRIATDLHDDIGSSLTQIAVLTEVARSQATSIQAENLTTPLERIKNVSKELVAVMSDVVWAINPQKDFLHDLMQRMRRFASDVFTTRGIRFEFAAPEIETDLQLGANIRREVFAIFKESVNNAVKYSECTAAAAKFRIEENHLFLEISDNGCGFDTQTVLSSDFRPDLGGNGLINIRRRVAELGGTCEISSEIGKGTTLKMRVPLNFQKNG
jgi:signal transduction histidine kinase/ligand-binding sensor domain-containing protein